MPLLLIVIGGCVTLCITSYQEGKRAGVNELCSTQFQGEMRKDKCVRIQAEILTIEPKK